jgi:GH25 family lysozyme M1 (1,4-beta-N-acetylmuramidase)
MVQMRKLKVTAKGYVKGMAALCAAAALMFAPVQQVQAIGAGSSIARGIDVSKHNLAIDWSQVPSSGVSFAFVKAGSTNSGVDPYFDVNMRGASAAGLRTGVYLYSYATTVEQAQNEADLLMQWISNYTVNYPVVYDIEDPCHKNMSQEQLQALINTFCSTVEAHGYYPVVYSSKNMFQNKIGNIKYDKWVAQYADALQYDGASFWQNTSHGSVPGIPTRVDMNYQFKDYSSVIIADGFADRGDQKVFYANYRMQRSCWVGWEDKKYHLDENGFVQKGCWFEDETGRYFLATKDGHALREDVTIEGVEYYFDENAVMQRGLVTRPDGNTYYYDENGALQRDVTVTIDGVTYEVNKNGVAAAVEASVPEAAGEPADAASQPEVAGEPAA